MISSGLSDGPPTSYTRQQGSAAMAVPWVNTAERQAHDLEASVFTLRSVRINAVITARCSCMSARLATSPVCLTF